MQRSIGAAIAGFAALASAEVLVRLAVDGHVADRSQHVLFPLAFAALGTSLCVLALLVVARPRSKRVRVRSSR